MQKKDELKSTDHYLISLNNSRSCDCGGKGNSLRRLITLGFDVPATYCLFNEAYECFLDRNNLRRTIAEVFADRHLSDELRACAIADAFDGSMIPAEVRVVVEAQKVFGEPDTLWAVRSSSNLEDMQTASSAGIYDSFLNLSGIDEIFSAVKKTWASLWSARAISYRKNNDLADEPAGMAVLIQRMVDAVCAGVLFTIDPLGSRGNRLIVEYCHGCGDQLVSGAITPFVVEMDRHGSIVRHTHPPDDPAMSDADWITLRDSALRAKTQLGADQDIEWAWDGSGFRFLQSRPITTPLKRIEPLNPEDFWTRANIGEVLPGPVTPLTWRIFLATLTGRPEMAFTPSEEGLNDSSLGIRLMHGCAYIRLDQFLDSFCYLPFVSPEVMHKVLGAPLHKSIQCYQPPKGMAVRVAQLFFWANVIGLFDRIKWMANTIADRPPIESSSIEALIGWSSNCFKVHLKATYYTVGAFAFLTRLLAGTGNAGMVNRLAALNVGSDYQTAGQGKRIAELADVVTRHPELYEFLRYRHAMAANLSAALADIPGGTEFLSMLDNFMRNNGARAAGEFELAIPRWREDPLFVIGSVLSMVQHNKEADPRKGIPAAEEGPCDTFMTEMGICRAFLFKWVLGVYQRLVVLRENLKYRLMEGYADLRTLIMEQADRFTRVGLLQRAEDIFFLEPEEIRAMQNNQYSGESIASLIANRSASFAKAQELSPPDLVTGEGCEVSIVRQDDSVMHGIGCSAGLISGPARVILDIADAYKLKPGEILVTKNTDPGWTPLFLICKAVVAEAGGILSHGATVAREYGIPAVASLKDATQRLSTGDWLQVDGGSGEVVVIMKKASNEVRDLKNLVSQSI